LVLVVMGVMVLTGRMTLFASWMLSTFPVLGRLGWASYSQTTGNGPWLHAQILRI